MISRKEAVELMHSEVKNKNLRKHMYAVEACMTGLAKRLGGDTDTWTMAGLLHDLDYEHTLDKPDNHAKVTVEMLADYDFPTEFYDAILAHADHKPAESDIEVALFSADPTTGLIVAAALMHPDKKLSSVDVPFIMRRFDEKRFAAGANRQQIKTCDQLGLELEEFIEVCLNSMQEIAELLGL